ncbi:hypothetical protein IFT77_10790 [Frigoribacterium sp. CFBP 13729]|uniref:hypothetical protein n=1 Tax=Frigoribacterium sp. CFBP 13729 TaxID=2775293 RepID=UPI00178777CA|nr:hypothetical protein [Frigoribacterium sp. CFBP 13729]MBD8610972.1 hypothetical protein [Frigoribacterium sp. CFBP 13729]
MPTRRMMSGESLEALRSEVRAVHGPGARIVAAQKVTVGGVAGVFARKHYEVTVEVPDPRTDVPTARITITPPASRAGIAALLADADAADGFEPRGGADLGGAVDQRGAARPQADAGPRDPFDDVLSGRETTAPRVVRAVPASPASAAAAAGAGAAAARPSAAASPRRAARAAAAAAASVPSPAVAAAAGDLSTRTDAFAEIMDDFTFNGIAAPEAPTAEAHDVEEAPAGPLTTAAAFLAAAAASSSAPSALAPGDAGDRPAPSVLRGAGDLVVVVGRPGDAFRVAAQMATSFGLRSVDAADRRGAILARATGVHEDSAVVTALAWDAAAPAALEAIAADQVWVAVDVGRKHDDTARWVEAVRAVQPVAAVAVVGEDDTSTPGTVHLLGVPVGWRA